MLWKRTQVPRGQEISGREGRRSREKGNQGVGDFRFINILHFFLFFFNLLRFLFFVKHFLPTTFTHTHDPRPLPTTHDPRHLATLNLEVYSISDLPCAQAYSHFLEVQSKFSRYKSRNLWQGFFWRFMHWPYMAVLTCPYARDKKVLRCVKYNTRSWPYLPISTCLPARDNELFRCARYD